MWSQGQDARPASGGVDGLWAAFAAAEDARLSSGGSGHAWDSLFGWR
jgi:hypothetical protein